MAFMFVISTPLYESGKAVKKYRKKEKWRASFPRLFLVREKCHMPQGKGKPGTPGSCPPPPRPSHFSAGLWNRLLHPSHLKRCPSLTPRFVLRHAGHIGGYGRKHRQGDGEDQNNTQGQLPDLKEKAELVLSLNEAIPLQMAGIGPIDKAEVPGFTPET